MTLDADVLILGGGCAGLSLAVALEERAPSIRVKILESRSLYTRDRTWCFWNSALHPFSAGVTHRWHNWRVRNLGAEAQQNSRQYAYEHLPADRFYDLAIAKLKGTKKELLLDVAVRSVQRVADDCAVETDCGVLRSRWVFDSRPQGGERPEPVLAQRFTGWHVRSEQPCFDPSIVDLMDFQPSAQLGRTMFFYLLPFSATEALVEATYLDVPSLPPANAEAALHEYLDRCCGAGYEVLYREAGSLPMEAHNEPTASVAHVVNIGSRGGRIKASSGYAFQRIQRQSAALASALASDTVLPRTFEPRLYSVLDHIFLKALRRFPDRVPDYFMAMFSKLPPETLVRFLSETASAGEVLRVMLALPKIDFMREAFWFGETHP